MTKKFTYASPDELWNIDVYVSVDDSGEVTEDHLWNPVVDDMPETLDDLELS